MVKAEKLIYQEPTWRTYNIVLSSCCIVISLIFGISNKRYAFAVPDSNLAKLCSQDPNHCTLESYISFMMWIPFFTSLLLFLACWYNSTRLIHCCIGFIVADLVLSFVVV